MSFLSLLTLVLVVCLTYRSFRRGGYRAFLSLTKTTLAYAFAILAHQAIIGLEVVSWGQGVIHKAVAGSLTVPAGAGSPLQRGLLWLEETNLPRVIAQRIEASWRAEQSLDITVLMDYAGHFISIAITNALCFIMLFVLARFTINLMTRGVVRALPPGTLGDGKFVGLAVGVIESALIFGIIAALLLPVMASLTSTHFHPGEFGDTAIVIRMQRLMHPIWSRIYLLP